MEVVLERDLLDNCKACDRVYVMGQYRSIPGKKKTALRPAYLKHHLGRIPQWLCNYAKLPHEERQYFYPHKSFLTLTTVELINKLNDVVNRLIESRQQSSHNHNQGGHDQPPVMGKRLQ